jgi:hypothetical protein
LDFDDQGFAECRAKKRWFGLPQFSSQQTQVQILNLPPDVGDTVPGGRQSNTARELARWLVSNKQIATILRGAKGNNRLPPLQREVALSPGGRRVNSMDGTTTAALRFWRIAVAAASAALDRPATGRQQRCCPPRTLFAGETLSIPRLAAQGRPDFFCRSSTLMRRTPSHAL